MEAGDGGAEHLRLAAERVQRLKRRLDQSGHAAKPWDTGAVSPGVVTEKLRQLIPHGWFLLTDVNWPGRPAARLDHVLVGPGGVVVVDAKTWTGEVSVSAGVLWQGRFARTQSVEGALAQCAAVAAVLAAPHRRFVRPLICLTEQAGVFGITNSDVAVAGVDRVVAAVLSLPDVLDQQTVAGLHAYVLQHLAQEAATASPSVPLPTVKPRTAGSTSRQAPSRHGRVGHTATRPTAARPASGGGVGLLFLAAFVVLAVYVLPYWGL